jgi:hypothetical protein
LTPETDESTSDVGVAGGAGIGVGLGGKQILHETLRAETRVLVAARTSKRLQGDLL